MNDFDVLSLVNIGLAAVALIRMRPGAFIFFGQQLITLRAFSSIRDYGKPASQSFLPSGLFAADMLATARWLFIISSCVVALSMLLGKRNPTNSSVLVPPPLPKWLLIATLAYFALTALSRKTILSGAYLDPDSAYFSFNFGGLNGLIAGFAIYECGRRVASGQWSPLRGFGYLVALFFASDIIHGATGYATGCIVLGAFLVLGHRRSGDGRRRWAYVLAAVTSMVLVASIVRSVRGELADEGGVAINDAVSTMSASESNRAQTGEGLESRMNGSQSAAHILCCKALYDSGHDRGWRSVYLPFVYTFQPSFMLEWLNIARDKEAAWEIQEYYPGGGGIDILGELYWNGGYLCVVVVMSLIALLIGFIDSRHMASAFWLMMACNFAPGLLMGSHYGFAQIFRGFANGLIGFAVLRLFLPRAAKRSLGEVNTATS